MIFISKSRQQNFWLKFWNLLPGWKWLFNNAICPDFCLLWYQLTAGEVHPVTTWWLQMPCRHQGICSPHINLNSAFVMSIVWRLLKLCASYYSYGDINSSPPSAAYMRRWTGSALAQVMACRLMAPSHYLNQCWHIVNWTLRSKLQWNFNRNSNIFIEENTIENVIWDFSTKLSSRRCVNTCTRW